MHRNRIAALSLFSFILLLVPAVAPSGMGIGISGRSEMVTIDAFPYAHEGTFSIHNTCEFDCFYVLEVYSPYEDVGSWIEITPKTATLEHGAYADIRYTLTATQGYAGSYDIRIIAKGFGIDEPASGDGKPVSYVQTSGSIRLSVTVTDDAGAASMGIQRPAPEIGESPDEATPPQETFCTIALDTPAYLDVPLRCQRDTPVHITGGLVSGVPPGGMHICMYAPSGAEYRLPLDYTYSFSEQGVWTATLALDEMVLVARDIAVEHEESRDMTYLVGALALCCGMVVIAYAKR